jgi:hypothetical protein
MRRGRTITFGGRTLTPPEALRFEVVRAVLLDQITLDDGAVRLAMPRAELARLIDGCRIRVIETLGEDVLEMARLPYRLAS